MSIVPEGSVFGAVKKCLLCLRGSTLCLASNVMDCV